jgi:hypothetical protein
MRSREKPSERWVPRGLAIFGAVALTGTMWLSSAHRGNLKVEAAAGQVFFGRGDCLDGGPYDYVELVQRTNLEIHGVAWPGPTTLDMHPDPKHPDLATYHFAVERDPKALGQLAFRPTDQITADAMAAAHCPVLPKE